jgi:Ser/Thr protein kinase RdoA (MazF antagonist)
MAMLVGLLDPGEVDRAHLFGGTHGGVSILVHDVLGSYADIHDAVVTRLARGHTNESFTVTTARATYVARRAWPGKPAAQIAAEERVLAALADSAPCDVPRIVPARDGSAHSLDDDRVVHLFTLCRGDVSPVYLAPTDHVRAHAAMSRLAELHRALARVPCTEQRAWAWLAQRLASVRDGDLSRLPPRTPYILERIATKIPATSSNDIQWLHGDYHLGNLLWIGNEVTGVVDFDDTGCGSALGEAAMALFAIARQPDERRFTYDTGLWDTGLAGYGAAIEADRDELMLRFCAYQVLIHLTAVQRRLWTLDDSLGFWPCWNTLREQ